MLNSNIQATTVKLYQKQCTKTLLLVQTFLEKMEKKITSWAFQQQIAQFR